MKHYIGVDVGKFALDMFDGSQSLQFNNDAKGIAKLIKKLQKWKNVFVIFEATGGYEKLLSKSLYQDNIPFHRAHPNKVRYFAKSMGFRAKTDKLDAQLLREFGASHQPVPDEACEENLEELKALLARRENLLEYKVREENRLDKLMSETLVSSIHHHIQWLKEEIACIEKQIKCHIDQNPKIKESIELYSSIKGVGLLTAAQLVANLPELGKITHNKISALVGVAPMNSDSGKKKGKRSIEAGRAPVRRILYMATLSAIRFNPPIKAHYERLKARGKPFKVAIVAAMRKLIIMANSVAARGTPWKESLERAEHFA